MKFQVSQDSFSVARGGDLVAEKLADTGAEVVRTGTHGLAWLEPMVNVQTNSGTLSFGPVFPQELIESSLQEPNYWSSSHPAYIGTLDSFDFYKRQHRLVFDQCGTAAPHDLNNHAILSEILAKSPEEIIQAIEVSGLRGRGGAGFPAHIKWRTVADTSADQKYIVCNADEGDSGTFVDRMLMEGDPTRLIHGMVAAGYATGATHGLVYLRSEYPLAAKIFSEALDQAYSENVLGQNILGSDICFDLELFIGAGAYICGEETSLLESLEGKRGQIKTKPPVPAIAGLFEKPTLVHNVISFAAVPGIFQIGPENYRDLGVHPSSGTMTFQLSGNINFGGLIELPFGITVRELLEDFGGGTKSGRPIRTVQIGGPLGAYLSESQLDTPLTYESMAEIGAGIGHGGLVVFDDTVDMLAQAEYAFDFCAIESCGKCTPCRIGAVRGREIMKQLRTGAGTRQSLVLVDDLCEVMEKASLCQMGGMTPIPVRSAIANFPNDFNRRIPISAVN